MSATRAQIEAQMADLQKQLESADTDDEIWIQEEGAAPVRVTGRRATAFLNRHKGLFEEPAGEAEGEGEEIEPDPQPEGDGLFKRRGKKQQ